MLDVTNCKFAVIRCEYPSRIAYQTVLLDKDLLLNVEIDPLPPGLLSSILNSSTTFLLISPLRSPTELYRTLQKLERNHSSYYHL